MQCDALKGATHSSKRVALRRSSVPYPYANTDDRRTIISLTSPTLLAVDLGIKTGLACFGRDGRLTWYRSTNFGSRARLKKAVPSVFRESGDVRYLAIEGGGDLADPWIGEAARLGAEVLQVAAHDWRTKLLLSRDRRTGEEAKKHADTLARRIIERSGAKRPTSLRHDVAEAICVGYWGLLQVGWARTSMIDD